MGHSPTNIKDLPSRLIGMVSGRKIQSDHIIGVQLVADLFSCSGNGKWIDRVCLRLNQSLSTKPPNPTLFHG